MKFVVDAQLPPALARAITAEGHDAIHVCDIGMTAASDHMVWREALRRDAVIVTKDEDFVLIGRAESEDAAPPVVLDQDRELFQEGITRRCALNPSHAGGNVGGR